VAGTISGSPLQTPETPAATLTSARIAANIAKLPVLLRLRGAAPGRYQLYAGRGAGLLRTDAKKLIKPSQGFHQIKKGPNGSGAEVGGYMQSH
jgi:hypothetical protein